MNTEKLQALLDEAQNKSIVSKYLWSPTPGTHTVRIVPRKEDPSIPFVKALIHYAKAGKTFISPTMYGSEDIFEKYSRILITSSDPKVRDMGYKLRPKTRYFAPVVVRGEEEKGIRWWGFGKEMFISLADLARDPEIGDYTDINTGRDLVLTTLDKTVTKKNFNTTTAKIKVKSSPLTSSKDQLAKLYSTYVPFVEVYPRLSEEELKETFDIFLKFEFGVKSIDDLLNVSSSGNSSNSSSDVPSKPEGLVYTNHTFNTQNVNRNVSVSNDDMMVETEPDDVAGIPEDDDDDLGLPF